MFQRTGMARISNVTAIRGLSEVSLGQLAKSASNSDSANSSDVSD